MTKLPIKVSGRHLHISKADLAALFGSDHKLTKIRPVDQPGQFACAETVTIKSKDGELKNLRIVGPEREATQVEITKTEAYQLKINPPIKSSISAKGKNGAMVELIGPKGRIKRESAIIARRHLHLNPKQAKELGFKDQDLFDLKIEGERAVIFKDILVRVAEEYNKAVHIDTDEANAANISQKGEGEIIR